MMSQLKLMHYLTEPCPFYDLFGQQWLWLLGRYLQHLLQPADQGYTVDQLSFARKSSSNAFFAKIKNYQYDQLSVGECTPGIWRDLILITWLFLNNQTNKKSVNSN